MLEINSRGVGKAKLHENSNSFKSKDRLGYNM